MSMGDATHAENHDVWCRETFRTIVYDYSMGNIDGN
jgi:hypothetical protein